MIPAKATVDGRIIVEFRGGELARILAIADSDEERRALLRQLEQAAGQGDLSALRDRDESL
jgi:hypothetical protein